MRTATQFANDKQALDEIYEGIKALVEGLDLPETLKIKMWVDMSINFHQTVEGAIKIEQDQGRGFWTDPQIIEDARGYAEHWQAHREGRCTGDIEGPGKDQGRGDQIDVSAMLAAMMGLDLRGDEDEEDKRRALTTIN
jgi:hypothetical protein